MYECFHPCERQPCPSVPGLNASESLDILLPQDVNKYTEVLFSGKFPLANVVVVYGLLVWGASENTRVAMSLYVDCSCSSCGS